MHQKIKFVTKRQLVSITTEEDMIAATSSGAPYVEANEKAIECSFKSLEFVNAMHVGEGVKVLVPKLSENTHSGIRQQKGPSWKRIREMVTRHVEANRCDPEKG